MADLSTGFTRHMSKLEKCLRELNKEITTTNVFLENLQQRSTEIVRKLSSLTSPSTYLEEFVTVNSFFLKYLAFLVEVNCKFEILQFSEKGIYNPVRNTETQKQYEEYDKSCFEFNLNIPLSGLLPIEGKLMREVPTVDYLPTHSALTSTSTSIEVQREKKSKKKKSKGNNQKVVENKASDSCTKKGTNTDQEVMSFKNQKKSESKLKTSSCPEMDSNNTNNQKISSGVSSSLCASEVKTNSNTGFISDEVKGVQLALKDIPVAEVTPTKSSYNSLEEADFLVISAKKEEDMLEKYEICEIKPPSISRTVGEEYEIVIENIKSPSEFYIHFTSNHHQDSFRELEEKLKLIAHAQNKMGCNLRGSSRKTYLSKEIGQYVLYYSKCDEIWCRARVTDWCNNYNDDFINIFLLDYGEYKCVTINDLQRLPENLKNYPAFAQRCHLYGIAPVGENVALCKSLKWERETREKMVFLTENSRKMKIIVAPPDSHHSPESLPVTLWLIDKGNKCVNDLLVKTKHAVKQTDTRESLVKSEDEGNKILENWNPMKQDYESYQNLYELNVSDPSAAIYNYIGKDYDRICIQFAKTGTCFKGEACRKEHTHFDPLGFTTDKEEIYKNSFNVLSSPLPGSVLNVQATCIFDLNQFWCITNDPVWCADDENFESLLKYMNTEENIRDMKKLLIPPSTGQIVIGQFTEDECWYRAKILESQPENDIYSVMFVDYGNTEKLPLSRIRAIEARYLHLPFQAMQCYIYGIARNPKVSPEEGFEYFKNRMSCEKVNIEVISKYPGDSICLLVHVFDSCGNNIGSDLIAKDYAIYKQELLVSNECEILPG